MNPSRAAHRRRCPRAGPNRGRGLRSGTPLRPMALPQRCDFLGEGSVGARNEVRFGFRELLGHGRLSRTGTDRPGAPRAGQREKPNEFENGS
jgi:hypothetical protein